MLDEDKAGFLGVGIESPQLLWGMPRRPWESKDSLKIYQKESPGSKVEDKFLWFLEPELLGQ